MKPTFTKPRASRAPMAARMAAIMAALALGACASVAPEGAPPVSPVPPAWQAPAPTTAPAADAAAGWAAWGDPLLVQLVDSALARSATLAQARARIERARASRVAADAALRPQLDAVASATTGRSLPRQPVASTASLGLQAAWELDVFGAVDASRSGEAARLAAAQAGWQAARLLLAAEVADSYLQLRACEAQLQQAQLDARSRTETARLSAESERAGFTAPADTALARAGAAQARALVQARQAQCDTLVKGLVEATGLDEPALRVQLLPGTAVLPQPAPLAVPLPADVLAQRPDVAEAARAVEAAAADQRSAAARERPQVRLSGSLAVASLRSGGFGASSDASGGTWQLGPLLVSVPVFDGGRAAANTAAARAEYEAAVSAYQARLRQALREVETALVALDSTARRQQDAEAAARDFEASLQATQARQRSGLASLFDLESARRNAVQAQSALIDLQAERAAAWMALHRALGGGPAAPPAAALTSHAFPPGAGALASRPHSPSSP